MLPLYGGGFAVAALQVTVVYYGVALLLHCLVPAALPVKSIQAQPRQPGQASREALYSLGPLAVKAAVLRAVELLGASSISRLYEGPLDSTGGVLYVVATVAALDVLHDAWFYWTHRLLHWRLLYRHVHHIHHRSVAPTAFAGYSFHVAEAALVFANEILVCFLFPIHAGVHRAYHLATTAIHIGGHAGYEIAPFIPSLAAAAALLHACAQRCLQAVSRQGSHDSIAHVSRGQADACGARADRECEGVGSSCRGSAPSPSMKPDREAGREGSREGQGGLGFASAQGRDSCSSAAAPSSPISKPCREGRAAVGCEDQGGFQPCAALNTVRHHDMHHRFPTRHFSLYFTHWDRWCGTEHPAYRAQVAEHFQALAAARISAKSLGACSAAGGALLSNSHAQCLPAAAA